MAFTVVPTITTGDVATAAWGNTHIKDNFAATGVGVAATAGHFVRVTGTTAVEEADPEDGAKLDGDHLDIDFTPSNYTPSTAPAEAADVDDLAAHLSGIDTLLGVDAQINTGSYTGDGATSQAITGVGFQAKYLVITRRSTIEADLGAKELIWTTDVIIDDIAAGAAINEGVTNFPGVVDNSIITLGADGFTVDDDGADEHPNKNTTVYNYLALG